MNKEKAVLNDVIEGLIKGGYSEQEAIALVAKLLEQEAEGYVAIKDIATKNEF